jgi:hypothetical protein
VKGGGIVKEGLPWKPFLEKRKPSIGLSFWPYSATKDECVLGFCFFFTELPTPAAYGAQLHCAAAGMDNSYSQATFFS